MRFREHRGSLASSMETAVEINCHAELLAHIRKAFWDMGPEFSDADVKVEPYGGDDPRIGWKNVHIVTIDGQGVIGFCEGDGREF